MKSPARLSHILLSVLAVAGLLTACGPQSTLISEADEAKIGAREHDKIVKSYGGIYDDIELGGYVAGVTLRVAQASERPDLTYRVSVLDTPQINAFALPGGYTYVTRGLLALANDEAELAAVMGHEIGHVTARHGAQRHTTAVGTSVLAGVLGVVLQSDLADLLVNIGANATLASYSRTHEYEADELGVITLHRAGYDAYAEADFLASMKAQADLERAEKGDDDGNIPAWLSTHPNTADRVDRARKLADEYSGSGVAAKPSRNRNAYLQAIDGMLFGETAEQGFIRDRTFLHPVLRFKFTVPPDYQLINTPKAVLAKGPSGQVIKFDIAGKDSDQSLADYLRDVWADGVRVSDVKPLKGKVEMVSGVVRRGGKTSRLVVAAVPQKGKQKSVYRLVMQAATDDFAAAGKGFLSTAKSLTGLTKAQAGRLKPLRIKVETVGNGQDMVYFVKKMRGVKLPERTFRVLNNVPTGNRLEPGRRVKIVTDYVKF